MAKDKIKQMYKYLFFPLLRLPHFLIIFTNFFIYIYIFNMRFPSAKALVENNTYLILHVKGLKNSGAICKFKAKNRDPKMVGTSSFINLSLVV